jgi:hypothetical protein
MPIMTAMTFFISFYAYFYAIFSDYFPIGSADGGRKHQAVSFRRPRGVAAGRDPGGGDWWVMEWQWLGGSGGNRRGLRWRSF